MIKRNLVKKICFCLVLAIAIFSSLAIVRPSIAQSDIGLRSDIASLNSRIRRLEQEVNRLRSSGRGLNPAPPQRNQPARQPIPNPRIVSPPMVNGEAIGRSDPLYERFATLLIELKEDVKNLDRRLNELEGVSQGHNINKS